MEPSNVLSQLQLLAAAYAERAALLDSINEACPWHVSYRRRTLELIEPLLGPNKRVLDLAAGTGIFSRQIATRVSSLTLADTLPSMLKLARAAFEAQGIGPDRVRFLQCDATSGESLGNFDLVLMTQALNFFADLDGPFAGVRASLAPGGVFYFDIDTPFRWAVVEAMNGQVDNAMEIMGRGRDLARNIVGADYHFHDRSGIEACLARHDMCVRAVRGVCHVSPLLHVFNASADFLRPDTLQPQASRLADADSVAKLAALDKLCERVLPPEAAGWIVVEAVRRED